MSGFFPFMNRYGANVAGVLYNTGGAFQLLAGAVLSSPRDIAAAILNFICSSILTFFGHKNAAIVVGSVLAVIVNILTAYAGLAAGEISSMVGILFLAGIQLICMFNAPLARQFSASSTFLLKETLGKPRRFVGVTEALFSHMPLMFGNGLHHRWVQASIFAIWTCADLAFSLSKPFRKES